MIETNVTSELALRVDARVIVNIVARRDDVGDTAVSHLRNVQQLLVLVEHECENEPGYRMGNASWAALKSRIASALALLEPQIELPMEATTRDNNFTGECSNWCGRTGERGRCSTCPK